jgi:hypothetical protein
MHSFWSLPLPLSFFFFKLHQFLTFCPCYMLSPLSLSLQFPSIFYFCMIFHFHLILDFLSPRETSVKLQRLPIHAILVWVNFSTSKKKKKRTMERKNENGNQFLGKLTLIMKVQKHEIFILIHSGSWGMLFFFHWNLESNSHLLLFSPSPIIQEPCKSCVGFCLRTSGWFTSTSSCLQPCPWNCNWGTCYNVEVITLCSSAW